MRLYLCMANERKNDAINMPSHVMGNFGDSQETLAYHSLCAIPIIVP